jgi:hypothetical protein
VWNGGGGWCVGQCVRGDGGGGGGGGCALVKREAGVGGWAKTSS